MKKFKLSLGPIEFAKNFSFSEEAFKATKFCKITIFFQRQNRFAKNFVSQHGGCRF